MRGILPYLRRMRHPLRWIAFWTYVLSLFLPVFQGSDLKGYYLVLFGVIGLVDMQWVLGLPWLANSKLSSSHFAAAWQPSAHNRRRRIPRNVISCLGHSQFASGRHRRINWCCPGLGIASLVFLVSVLLAADALLGPRAGVRKRRKSSATSTVHVEDPELESGGAFELSFITAQADLSSKVFQPGGEDSQEPESSVHDKSIALFLLVHHFVIWLDRM